jgi:hypothetical protein
VELQLLLLLLVGLVLVVCIKQIHVGIATESGLYSYSRYL